MVTEKANYITCPLGHKIFVIWSPMLKEYGFTCEECKEHSLRALSLENKEVLQIKVVGKMA